MVKVKPGVSFRPVNLGTNGGVVKNYDEHRSLLLDKTPDLQHWK
jgi:hypothetical protein